MAKIVAYIPDMMDRSRVASAAGAAGRELEVVRTATELAERAGPDDLVLIDLGRPGALEALPGLEGIRSVGFVSHLDRDLIRAARRAGCRRVLARSAFFSGLGELLASSREAGGDA